MYVYIYYKYTFIYLTGWSPKPERKALKDFSAALYNAPLLGTTYKVFARVYILHA